MSTSRHARIRRAARPVLPVEDVVGIILVVAGIIVSLLTIAIPFVS